MPTQPVSTCPRCGCNYFYHCDRLQEGLCMGATVCLHCGDIKTFLYNPDQLATQIRALLAAQRSQNELA